jgi:hypothetical protein
MRFSLRWLMVSMAYVAVATTAIATGSDLLADLISALSLLAVSYAIVVACIATRQRQAIAVGFLTLAIAHLVGLYLIPDRVPAMRLLNSAGYMVSSKGDIYEHDPTRPGAVRTIQGMTAVVRTANAIGTLATGLIGCLIGGLAYRQVGEPPAGPPKYFPSAH